MRRRSIVTLVALAGSAAALGGVYAAYSRDMDPILAAVAGGQRADTAAGPIEYGREGAGSSVLMIHGAGGGFDQGLLVGREMFGPGFDLIAPSRFGYLGTPVPVDPSPAAQADAHAALLDRLGVRTAIVVGVSAGAPSAIEMALRHPDRVSALILAVPRAYAPGAPEVSSPIKSEGVLNAVMSGADFPFWLATKVARRSVVRFLGVPPEVDANAAPADRERVTTIIRSVLPLSRRVDGLLVDSEAEIRGWPLERIAAPTLVLSAEDDLYGTLAPARYTAEHIPGAELMVLPSGGHLMVGQGSAVRQRIEAFLARLRPSLAAAA
jgi:2-hydroxy-6-oxonona-2,4-dienedioate hydrolase